MSYDVKIIADSVSPSGARITTFQLMYPRMVHSEMMTHRIFSRNAGSTRAIPTEKMIQWILDDPAIPVYWGKNQKGMQATEELTESQINLCKFDWLNARNDAVYYAKALIEEGVHKQIVGRILEPFAHINVVVTSTSFDNFFALRCHKDAQPEMQVLAVKMARAYRDSVPDELEPHMWHLPYVTSDDVMQFNEENCLKISTARCCRVSYLTVDGKPSDPEADMKLHDQLQANGHWSPFEHPAMCSLKGDYRSGNFVGWFQYRQLLQNRVHTAFDYSILDQFQDKDFIV